MSDFDFHEVRGGRRRGNLLVANCVFAWIVPAVVLTIVQVIGLGRVTPVVLAGDVVAGALLPFGLLSLALASAPSGDDGAGSDEDGGGGGGGGGGPSSDDDFELPPTGGLAIDWQQFEADFRAYADAVSHV